MQMEHLHEKKKSLFATLEQRVTDDELLRIEHFQMTVLISSYDNLRAGVLH